MVIQVLKRMWRGGVLVGQCGGAVHGEGRCMGYGVMQANVDPACRETKG